MGDTNNAKRYTTDEIIAAFDRQRNEVHEHSRRATERLRNARRQDAPGGRERQNKK
jgi:hypothetical protein